VRWRRLGHAAIIGSMLRSALVTTTALFLAACSQEHDRAAGARFRLVATAATAAQPLLSAHAEAAAVLLADARLGVDLASARTQRVPQLVQFGEASATASQRLAAGQIEAAIVCRDEGAAAADLALLAVTGHTIPMRAPLGVHANAAALIVVASTRSSLLDARRAARTAKIPVLLVGHSPAADDDALTCWVGADDRAMATATVSALQQLVPDGGEVVDAAGTALPAAVRTAIEATRAPAAR
jgi:hypothetical protein